MKKAIRIISIVWLAAIPLEIGTITLLIFGPIARGQASGLPWWAVTHIKIVLTLEALSYILAIIGVVKTSDRK